MTIACNAWLKDWCDLSAGGLGVRIKWPNDLYIGTEKLGGVLCNSVFRDRQFQVPSDCLDADFNYALHLRAVMTKSDCWANTCGCTV